MGVIDFKIEMEKTYFVPGENVNGRLIIGLDSEENMDKISVTFHGMGSVKIWSKISGTKRVLQYAENYFNAVACELYLNPK